jgi:hypothetical protein
MSVNPVDPTPDSEPDVVPSSDPDPIQTEPLPEHTQPGEDPGVAPDHPELEPPEDPLP